MCYAGFNGIADQGASSLARSLASNRSLKTLYLSGNSIGPTGARALAGSLAGGLATLHLSASVIALLFCCRGVDQLSTFHTLE